MEKVWIAFGLTLFAGMATGIGSLIAFAAKRTNYRFLAVSTGFSAGVMLYISFVEIFFKGAEALTARYGSNLGHWINAASFFGGMAIIGLIDNLIPAGENPHEPHPAEEIAEMQDSSAPPAATASVAAGAASWPPAHDHDVGHSHLMRTGLFAALAVGYLAIRLFVGGSASVIPTELMGILFAGVAGIMVYISVDELLPTSRAYGKGHDSLFGLICGMVVMAVSLLLL